MLEVLNKRKKQIDMDNMRYINPFFKKALVKNQKKIFKWLTKFSYQQVIDVAPKFAVNQAIDYNDYLAFVNNANNLLFSKYKKMFDNLKVISKLRKMLNDYAVMNSIYSFILIVNDFYQREQTTDSYDKRKYWIQLYNEYINQIWDRYKLEFLNVFRDDEVLKNKAQQAFNFDKQTDDQLFFPKQTMEILFGFLKKVWSHKRIIDKEFNAIYLYTIFTYEYMYALDKLMQRILLSYPVAKPKKEHHLFHKKAKKEKDSH